MHELTRVRGTVEKARNVALTGRGKVNGQGGKFTVKDGAPGRPHAVKFMECQDVLISDVRVEDSASWVVHLLCCERAVVRGVKVEELRRWLEKETGKKVRVNIQEIRVPELSAYLVAQSISEQLRRRVAFKRAIKQAALRSMQRGAKGVKVVISGRLGGAEMSRREREVAGKVPAQTLRAGIDFAIAEALTTYGIIGIKVWIYKGDILPQRKVAPRPAAPQVQEGLPTRANETQQACIFVAMA
jgi:ribosomal protein S3